MRAKTVIFTPEQLRLLLAHRQLKWSAFINKKVIMIERISFHGKVGKHLGRYALICTAQYQFVAIHYLPTGHNMSRVLNYAVDPRFPARGTSIKYLMRQTSLYHGRVDDLDLNIKIIRGHHEQEAGPRHPLPNEQFS